MTRSTLLLASSAMRSLAFAMIVLGSLVVGNKAVQAQAVSATGCGTPDDLQRTCPDFPACTKDVCTYATASQPGKPTISGCVCSPAF